MTRPPEHPAISSQIGRRLKSPSSLALTLTMALLAALIVSCGGGSAEPTSTSIPASPTEAPTSAPDTPTPAPTATAAPTQAPTMAPEPTNTPEPTEAPQPTATSVPTATPEPTASPTATPVPTEAPTSTPEPTDAPEPTHTPEPTETPQPTATTAPTPEPAGDSIVSDLAPLGGNLQWVAHFSNSTKEWSVYDPSGTFSPEMLPLAGQDVPDASEINSLTVLAPRQIYWLMLNEAQSAVLGGASRNLNANLNGVVW